MGQKTKTIEPVWDAIRDRLERKRIKNFGELRSYPRQVTGCDTYYQYLAEQRAKISGERRQLDALRGERPIGGIEEFIRSLVLHRRRDCTRDTSKVAALNFSCGPDWL